jgi:hypothetical protein
MKKFAPLAVLFGLLTALLLGSTATAQATTPNGAGTFKCSNGINVLTVNCNNILDNVKIDIKGNRVLTTGEISILENNLNNAKIDVDVYKLVVIDTYKSFNPIIVLVLGDINVCIACK